MAMANTVAGMQAAGVQACAKHYSQWIPQLHTYRLGNTNWTSSWQRTGAQPWFDECQYCWSYQSWGNILSILFGRKTLIHNSCTSGHLLKQWEQMSQQWCAPITKSTLPMRAKMRLCWPDYLRMNLISRDMLSAVRSSTWVVIDII